MEPEDPISIAHFTHVLTNYRHVILLALASILLACMIVAVAMYVLSPVQRVTSQLFRLDFEGAGKGEYPNRTKFNIADLISGPILGACGKENRLGDYIGYDVIAGSEPKASYDSPTVSIASLNPYRS